MKQSGIQFCAPEAPHVPLSAGERVAFHLALANPEQKGASSYLEILGGLCRREPFR
jgi:hypothetical protein